MCTGKPSQEGFPPQRVRGAESVVNTKTAAFTCAVSCRSGTGVAGYSSRALSQSRLTLQVATQTVHSLRSSRGGIMVPTG